MMKLPIEQASEILISRISEVKRVKDWAKVMGYAESTAFSNEFRNHFGKRPQSELNRVRLECIKQLMMESPDEKLFCIAQKAGLDDEKRLYNFISYHADISPSQLAEGLKKNGSSF